MNLSEKRLREHGVLRSLEEIEGDPSSYSEWCVEEAKILQKTPRCKEVIGL